MIKALRRNVVVDCGKTINQLGADAIITPDKYKRLNNIGTILSVGSKCRYMDQSFVGKKCIVDIVHHGDNRISPSQAQKLGMDNHWYFNVHEKIIIAAW